MPAPGRRSAGIVLYRSPGGPASADCVEVLLGHMGGPLWSRKDAGAWTIPKGEHDPDEDPLAAARREFLEELGVPVPATELRPLGEIRQSGGKTVTAWAAYGDLDPAAVVPGTFSLEWPPRSGTLRDFPELDRVAWFEIARARELVVRAQSELLDRLVALLRAG